MSAGKQRLGPALQPAAAARPVRSPQRVAVACSAARLAVSRSPFDVTADVTGGVIGLLAGAGAQHAQPAAVVVPRAELKHKEGWRQMGTVFGVIK